MITPATPPSACPATVNALRRVIDSPSKAPREAASGRPPPGPFAPSLLLPSSATVGDYEAYLFGHRGQRIAHSGAVCARACGVGEHPGTLSRLSFAQKRLAALVLGAGAGRHRRRRGKPEVLGRARALAVVAGVELGREADQVRQLPDGIEISA